VVKVLGVREDGGLLTVAVEVATLMTPLLVLSSHFTLLFMLNIETLLLSVGAYQAQNTKTKAKHSHSSVQSRSSIRSFVSVCSKKV
jgi:hypothetical protein